MSKAIQWLQSKDPVPYEDAVREMDAHVSAIHTVQADDLVWLLEHPPLYTGGTSAKGEDLLDPRFPVYKTGRGGEYTYHGPGQRVAYVMTDLKHRQKGAPDIKAYVCALERWVIEALKAFDIEGARRDGRIGVWVTTPSGQECKIAAVGVRVRHWITLHGIALNVDPDLSHFGGIVPCGIKEFGVTSMSDMLGHEVSLKETDHALKNAWPVVFD
jgi:lipoyl(octanoyl) transferase